MIVTFYSYKGGVGRSMALVNVAELLADAGYRVVVCDFDLEAPGLERYFADSAGALERYRSQEGVIDLLEDYKVAMGAGDDATEDRSADRRYAERGGLWIPRPSGYLIEASSRNPRRGGSVSLLTAGRRDGRWNQLYSDRVQQFDWDDFYASWAGDVYIDFLREDLTGGGTIVLVDSRTGVTEQGGVCTHHLADLVVLLSAANDLNVDGTVWMANVLASDATARMRQGRPLKVLPVAARIEVFSQVEELASFRRRFQETFVDYVPAEVGDPAAFIGKSEIPYVPFYAFKERIVARPDEVRQQELYDAYETLTRAIVAVGVESELIARPTTAGWDEAVPARPSTQPERGEPVDFFISYASADRAWAEWIAWQLEGGGYRVVVQAWELTPGSSWIREMEHAISTVERVLVVLSPAYLASTHGEPEWRLFDALDPTGALGLLLPVRVLPVEPPAPLATQVFVDLVDKGADEARAALLAAAKGARGRPAAEPEYPVVRTLDATPGGPRFPDDLPPIWNVPFHANSYFTDREELLLELHTLLNAPEAHSRRVALVGLGGVGKTQLAVEYAYRQRADYDLVWWVRAEQPTAVPDYVALADELQLTSPRGAQREEAAAVRRWLDHNRRWLLVLDNAEASEEVVALLPRSTTGHVLLTSRDVGWERLAFLLDVGTLPRADAVRFLLQRTKETGPEAEAAAATVAELLGDLPLALEQAAAFTTAGGTTNLSRYAELLTTRASRLLGRGRPPDYGHTVESTWSLALERLRSTDPAALGFLDLAAFLAPDDLPEPLLLAHHELLPEPLATAASDPLDLSDTIAALRRFSLVQLDDDRLSVHRLLQTVVRGGLEAEAERTWAAAAVRLLSAGFSPPSDAIASWPEYARLLPHALAAAENGQRVDVEPEERLRLLHQMAVYLSRRGRYQEAVALLERYLSDSRRVLGPDHPDTLVATSNLAATLQALGDLKGARDLGERLLGAARRVLGPDHPDTLVATSNLATTLQALGDLQGARLLAEQALAGTRRVLGDDHPDTLVATSNLAATLQALGDLQGARDLAERALEGARRVLGDDHPDTLSSMGNLALILQDLGDLQGARELQERVLATRRRVLGDDHPDTLVATSNLAATLQALGDLQGARDLAERALEGARRVLGDDHPDTRTAMQNLTAVRQALGDDHPDIPAPLQTIAEDRWTLVNLPAAQNDPAGPS